MASSIDLTTGDASSRPTRMVKATVDFTSVASYVTGGHEDATLKAELDKMGANAYSIPAANHNGTSTRWFQVDIATGKVKAYTTASLEVEVTAAVDLSGHTAIAMVVLGE